MRGGINEVLIVGGGIGGLTLALGELGLEPALAQCISEEGNIEIALKKYETVRLGPTSNVVLENRRNPPDAILRELYQRTGDQPFERVEAVISPEELQALSDSYKRVAGYDKGSLHR
jgi:hypothetical protein